MADKTELEKLLDEDENKTKDPALEKDPKDPPQDPKIEQDPELLKKEEHKKNLDKAIREGNDELKRIRDAKKAELQGKGAEEEIPKIDENDPSVKAWNKKINDKVDPALSELEKEKEEVRTFALQKFLDDKPALSRNPDKIKELVQYYEKIKTASERTQEGVLIDLNKAYAIVFHDEILKSARDGRVGKAKSDSILADAATDGGATGYSSPRDVSNYKLTEDDKQVLARWGMTPEEWIEMKKKHG